MEAVDLGDLEKIRIGHDSSGGEGKGSAGGNSADLSSKLSNLRLLSTIRGFIWLVLGLGGGRRPLTGSETALPMWPLAG